MDWSSIVVGVLLGVFLELLYQRAVRRAARVAPLRSCDNVDGGE